MWVHLEWFPLTNIMEVYRDLEIIEDAMLFTTIITLTQLLEEEEEEEDEEEEVESVQIERQRVHTSSLTGHAWLHEMLEPDKHPKRIRRLFRMSRTHFLRLVDVLKIRELLKIQRMLQ